MNNQKQPLAENNSWNHLQKWDTLIDEKIRGLIGDGDMSWHPLAGQRLELGNDELTPEDQRLAYKIMQENEAIPAWMSLGFVLRDKYEKIMRRLQQYVRDYQRRKQNALAKGSFVMLQQAEDRWQSATNALREDIDKYNSELLNYNLQVPPVVGQMTPLAADAEIQKALQNAG